MQLTNKKNIYIIAISNVILGGILIKMSSAVIKIIIFTIVVFVFIYVVKNSEKFLIKKEKINKKIFKIILVLTSIILIIIMLKFIYKNINGIILNIDAYNFSKNSQEMIDLFDKEIKKENKYYFSKISLNYDLEKSKKPYIFEGFKYIEGEWNTGFVIEDENNNQYVWVPCSNIENEEIVKLEKYNFDNPAFISKDLCADDSYEKFIESALSNGGFYVSRFEIGNEENKPVSKKNVNLWSNITIEEAKEITSKMYENSNINCELINGYAYDTALNWISKTNEISPISFDVEKEEIKAGRNVFNNIYDLADNIFELTLEKSYDTIIIRGFVKDEDYKERNRYSILKEENNFTSNNLLTMRCILYK